MTALVLFPSRIKFVNADGTLTPEAYRALSEIVSRTGGALGSVGTDTYGDIVGDASASDLNVAYTDVVQPIGKEALLEMVAQPTTPEQLLPDVVQHGSYQTPTASGGAAPAGGVGTAAGGYDTAVNRDAAITLLNNIRTALIAAGIMT
jgi:hypothetical protein